MLNDLSCNCPVYIACGYTDMRRGIDGLAGIVQAQFQMDPFQSVLFLFCGRRRDRIKALYWEGDGFVLLYKIRISVKVIPKAGHNIADLWTLHPIFGRFSDGNKYKKHEYTLENLPEDILIEVTEHRIPESELVCPECGCTMTEIGKEVTRKLKLIPAKLVVLEDWYYTYACRNCEDNGISTPVIKAPKEPAISPGSFASPKAIAHLMTQKFVMG